MCYTYDSLGRVTSSSYKGMNDEVYSTENFTYDSAGNITNSNYSYYEYDTNNRLVSISGNTVTYDLDGNMLSDGTNTFEYDSANRLIKAGGHTYTYNAEDVRIRNLRSEANTTYTYNTNCKLSQLLQKTTNTYTTKFVYGHGLIGEEKDVGFKTYHFDLRGSTVAITDINGNITDGFRYDTYGNVTAHFGETFVIFGYNGRDGVITDNNGLIYMRARYYNPAIRRFVNADVLHGEISDSTSLNRYSYVNGNPVSYVDPFGLSAERGGPTAMEAAYMARHIYTIYDNKQSMLIGGWKYEEDKLITGGDGMVMGVYSRVDANGNVEYALVNRGTVSWNLKDSDIYNNLFQPFGASNDMKASIKLAKEFVDKNSDSHITFIGHSKGGAEAAANAVATNRDAILFNPATVSLGAYDLNSNTYSANMTAYIVKGEILNNIFGWMSEPIDDVVYLPNQGGSAIDNHLMADVISALNEKGYT